MIAATLSESVRAAWSIVSLVTDTNISRYSSGRRRRLAVICPFTKTKDHVWAKGQVLRTGVGQGDDTWPCGTGNMSISDRP